MPEPTIAWKKDSIGYFIELPVAGKKDYSIDWSEFLPVGTVITDAAWNGPAGVDITDKVIAQLVTQAKIRAVQAGEHPCSVTITWAGGVQPVPFRVLVK